MEGPITVIGIEWSRRNVGAKQSDRAVRIKWSIL